MSCRCWLSLLLLVTVLPLIKGQNDPPPEKTIYIPYNRLWETFEKDKRGVFLPYEQFQQLWQKAYGDKPVEPAPLPRDSTISAVQGFLSIGENSAEGSLKLTLHPHQKGWQVIPLRLGECAILDFSAERPDTWLIQDDKQGFALLIKNTADTPAAFHASLKFACAITKKPGLNTLDFAAPLSPINLWEATIPQPDLTVTVAGDGTVKRNLPSDSNSTRLQLQLGRQARPSLSWTPRVEGAKGLKPIVNLQSRLQFHLEGEVMSCQADVTFEISRTPLGKLTLELPADLRIVQVFAENLRQWKTQQQDGMQRLELELYEGILGKQPIRIEMEKNHPGGVLELPCLQAPDALRQTGAIALFPGEGLKTELLERQGVSQTPVQDWPTIGNAPPPAICFQYANVPWKLRFQIEKLKPVLIGQTLNRFILQPETLDYLAIIKLETGPVGIFQTNIDLPANFTLVDCQAGDETLERPCLNEKFLESGDKGRQLLRLNFNAQVKKPLIRLHLRRALQIPALLTPGQPPALLDFPLLRLHDEHLLTDRGQVEICARSSLRLVPQKSSHLRELLLTEAAFFPENLAADISRRVVYAYAAIDPMPELQAHIERRPSQTEVSELLSVSLQSGNLLKFSNNVQIQVLYSGLKQLGLSIPDSLAGKIQLKTPGYSLLPDKSNPEPAPEGWQNWIIRGEKEFFGRQYLTLDWQLEAGELLPGDTKTMECPHLRFVKVERSWGQIILLKGEMSDLTAVSSEKLLAIDPRFDLRDGLKMPDAAAAFEFHGDWSLSVALSRYQNAPVKSSSIERALVRMVQTRNGQISVQVACNLRSVRQRLELRLPSGAHFDNNPLRLGNRIVPLEKGEEGQFFVPLVSLQQGENFLLELRYVLPEETKGFPIPVFPDDTAIQQVYLSVYLPQGRSLLGKSGDWNPENIWVLRGALAFYPRAKLSSAELLSWVRQGLYPAGKAPDDNLDNFVVDGQALLYSALHPDTAEAGLLRLRTAPSWLCKGIVLILIIAVGLLLCKASLYHKLLSLGCIGTVLGLLAVFLPNLLSALISNASGLAGIIVVFAWFLFWLKTPRPSRKAATPPPLPEKTS
jgi:hypothetical protein